MKLSDTIIRIRKESGLNQLNFSIKLKVTQSAISKFEREVKAPSKEFLNRLVKFAISKKIKIKLKDIFTED